MVEDRVAVGLPRLRYDITMPIADGRVTVPGVRFVPSSVGSMVQQWDSPLARGEFGLVDLNLGYFFPALEAGWPLIGLPIITKRKPVFPLIFCRRDRAISHPRQLSGLRIASRQFRTALTIWARGLLAERYGVDWSTTVWWVGQEEVFPVDSPVPRVLHEGGGAGVLEGFFAGEADVLISDVSDRRLFARLEEDPAVVRLFPDYMEEDLRLYRETGIYTPVHLLVLNRHLAEEHPDLPRKLYDAFVRAKEINDEDLLSERAGFSVIYLRERVLEQQRQWGDPWAHGMTANRATLETFARYNFEQGLVKRLPRLEDAFAASTWDT